MPSGASNVAMTPTPTSPSPISDRVSAIENEIPDYRAISPLAITSILLGLASALSFADPWFVIIGVLAVVSGLLAIRNVQRFPTVLTGKSIAQAGIGLALAFSLSSVTISFMTHMILSQKADAFGRVFTKVVQSNNLADAMWYRSQPASRRGSTPREMLAEMEKLIADKISYEERLGPVRDLLERANRPGAKLTFEKVESAGNDRMSTYAVLLYKIEGGGKPHEGHDLEGTPGHPTISVDDDNIYVAVEIKSEAEDPSFSWYVNKIIMPYELKSHVLVTKPADDGHGHGH